MTPDEAPLARRGSLLAAALLLAGPLASAETHPWTLGVSQSLTHDSNVYQVGGLQALPAGLSKADTLSTTTLLGGLDLPYGRQHFTASLSLRDNRYRANGQLDNTGHSVNLGWDWATIDRLSGSLTASTDRSLAQFNSINTSGTVDIRRNIVDTEQIDAVARLGRVTRYTFEGALGYRSRSYSAPEYAPYEYRQGSALLGLRFAPSTSLALRAALRQTDGNYPHFNLVSPGVHQDDPFTRQDLDLTAWWTPRGNSQIYVRFGPTRTRFDHDPARNFSGLTGAARWIWQASGKLKLTTLLSRDSGQSADAVNLGIFGQGVVDSSTTTTALQLRGDWDVTAKIGVNASATHAHRALVNTPSINGVLQPAVSGADDSTTLALGARWAPLRSLLLGCDFSAARRSSDGVLTQPMNDNSFGCFGQFTLQ